MELRQGAYGPEVSEYKAKLKKLGYPVNDEGLNKGAFGEKTAQWTRDFQRKHNLTPDAWAGRFTLLKMDYEIAKLEGKIEEPEQTPGEPKPEYWKPHKYHPMFVVPKGYTHLHPLDILRSCVGQREIFGSKDNPFIAHTHEHSGNLGLHSEGADYSDEVPHCASGQNWAADGAGCYKSDNALASSWGKPYIDKYKAKSFKKGDLIPEGALVCIDGHITMANRSFVWDGKGSFEGFGANQGNTYKASTYPQSRIKYICLHVPKPGTRLAPIGTKPVPSTGNANESTR